MKDVLLLYNRLSISGIILLFLLGSCKDPKKVKVDWESNRFYADYVKIYEGYGVKPLDSTKLALNDFLTAFPNDAKAWAFYGKVLLDQDSLEAARKAYERGYALDSLMPWNCSGLGVVASRTGDYSSAERWFTLGQKLGDSTLLLPLNLSIAELMLNKKETARVQADVLAKHDSLDNYFKKHLFVIYSELQVPEVAAKFAPEANDSSAVALYQRKAISAIDFFLRERHDYDGRK
ncbi:MAG: hypothetical protein U0T84_13850 [Chitinophagales bacterium]